MDRQQDSLIFDYLKSLNIGERYWAADIDKCRTKAEIVDWIKNRTRGQGLLFTGAVGVGKTSSMVCIIKELLKTKTVKHANRVHLPFGVIYTSSNHLYNAIFRKNYEFIDRCKRYRLLLIDDFGREYHHDFPFSEFEEVVEYRYSRLLTTVITTNFTVEKLRETLDYQRVVDRWRECCRVVQVGGDSMRKKNGKK